MEEGSKVEDREVERLSQPKSQLDGIFEDLKARAVFLIGWQGSLFCQPKNILAPPIVYSMVPSSIAMENPSCRFERV